MSQQLLELFGELFQFEKLKKLYLNNNISIIPKSIERLKRVKEN